MLLEIVAIEVGGIHDPSGLEQLLMCMDDTLADSGSLRPEERSLLLGECAGLQLKLESLHRKAEFRARHRSPVTSRTVHPSPTRDSFFTTTAPNTSQPVRDDASLSELPDESIDIAPRVTSPTPNHHFSLYDDSPQQTMKPKPICSPTADDNDVSVRLQMAADEIQNQRKEWKKQQRYLEARIAELERDVEMAEEKVLVKERQRASLESLNAQLTDRIGSEAEQRTRESSALLLCDRLSTFYHRTADLYDASIGKQRNLYSESVGIIVGDCLKVSQRTAALEAELRVSQRHLQQQQKALESSRRAVLSAWGDDNGQVIGRREAASPLAASPPMTRQPSPPPRSARTTVF